MLIRKTKPNDQTEVLFLYEQARSYMHSHGNVTQWIGYPNDKSLKEDMAKGMSYVVEDDSKAIVGTFALMKEPDPNYQEIDGAWLSKGPYVTVHRIASSQKGVGTYIFKELLKQYKDIRVDTHKDNARMRALLVKMGFSYCGVIKLITSDGSERLAYELVR
jgi:RimJ/RimL family protein N-acetyltransferase